MNIPDYIDTFSSPVLLSLIENAFCLGFFCACGKEGSFVDYWSGATNISMESWLASAACCLRYLVIELDMVTWLVALSPLTRRKTLILFIEQEAKKKYLWTASTYEGLSSLAQISKIHFLLYTFVLKSHFLCWNKVKQNISFGKRFIPF